MPTLLELSGLAAAGVARRDRALVSSAGTRRRFGPWNRPAFTELPARLDRPPTTAIISEGWKLVRIGGDSGEDERFELYRYREDPTDQIDVAGEHPDVVARLKEQLERFHQFAATARLNDDAATDAMDAEELERLRSLGYVQ